MSRNRDIISYIKLMIKISNIGSLTSWYSKTIIIVNKNFWLKFCIKQNFLLLFSPLEFNLPGYIGCLSMVKEARCVVGFIDKKFEIFNHGRININMYGLLPH